MDRYSTGTITKKARRGLTRRPFFLSRRIADCRATSEQPTAREASSSEKVYRPPDCNSSTKSLTLRRTRLSCRHLCPHGRIVYNISAHNSTILAPPPCPSLSAAWRACWSLTPQPRRCNPPSLWPQDLDLLENFKILPVECVDAMHAVAQHRGHEHDVENRTAGHRVAACKLGPSVDDVHGHL